MSKYKTLFLSETGEHLDALESELVYLEQRPDDEERVHEVFRHLHSVKSMSASMGYDSVSRLAHRLEDLVAPHREAHLPLTGPEVDLLLRGLDELRQQVKVSADDRHIPEPSEALMRQLTELIRRAEEQCAGEPGSRPTKTAEPPESEQPQTEKTEDGHRERAPSADGHTYRIALTVAPDCALPAVRAFVAYKRLAEIGQVLRCEPGVEQLRAGQLPERGLTMQVRTDKLPDDIRKLTDGLAELERIDVHPTAEPAGASPVEAPFPLPGAGATTTVRVRTDLLDFIVDSVGELITLRSYFEQLSERLDAPVLHEGVRRMGSVVRKLQDRVMEVRMVPVSILLGKLPRVCRDAAHSRGKLVDFATDGEGVELDRALVEALDTPLLHLVRNAIEHGIESPAEREAAGKPARGSLQLKVQRQQDRVQLLVSDDGCGIDPERVLQSARHADLVPTGQPVSDQEKLDLIFKPGLSTRDGVSDLSGRGVGLDVVRDTLHRLGGRVSVESEVGRGTTFVLDLPLTLAILQILLVQTGDHILALPASRVLRAVAVRPDQFAEGDGSRRVWLAGRSYPFVDLDQLLTRAGRQSESFATDKEVLLVGRHEQPKLALGVNRVTGHRETVLKSVGRLLRELGPYNASTVLGDGRPVLILDVDALLERAGALYQEPTE